MPLLGRSYYKNCDTGEVGSKQWDIYGRSSAVGCYIGIFPAKFSVSRKLDNVEGIFVVSRPNNYPKR